MSEDQLVDELTALGGDLRYPETPALTAGVLAGIAGRRRRRQRLIVAAAVVAATAVAIGILPGPRQAVARMLGIGSVRIEQIRSLDLPPATPTDAMLGRRTTFAEAADAAGFTPLVPELAGFDDPEVFVSSGFGAVIITLRYPAPDGSPGLVITQLASDRQILVKQAGEATSVRETLVNGSPALWVEGAHTISLYTGTDGSFLEDRSRLVGNTLIWETGGVTLRLESALTMEDALTIATSMGDRNE